MLGLANNVDELILKYGLEIWKIRLSIPKQPSAKPNIFLAVICFTYMNIVSKNEMFFNLNPGLYRRLIFLLKLKLFRSFIIAISKYNYTINVGNLSFIQITVRSNFLLD